MSTPPKLTIRNLRAVPVMVPMTYVLGTSQQAVREAPLLLVDLETEEGVTGRAWQFCYLPAAAPAIAILLEEVLRTVRGDRIEPEALWAKLAKRFVLIGVQGIVRMAMAMFDVAAWDALARAAGMPLGSYLGGTSRAVPAYNSCGLGLKDDPAAVADEAQKLLAGGFLAIKLRLGHPTLEADVTAVRAVRSRVPADIALMVDYNQALTVEEAIRRGRALDREGVYWMEEPIRHDDFAGCAEIARALATPVQIGENFSFPLDMERALAAQSCDYVMPDLERIGGVTGWRRAAELAAARGIRMSSHLYPEVSAHLLAVTPTAHWLEYVDWANAILEEPLRIVDGAAVLDRRAGNGLSWDEDAVRRYRVN
ncbi:MAG: enolase C-terminal domain-like protein [Burkholderiales bacterium]